MFRIDGDRDCSRPIINAYAMTHTQVTVVCISLCNQQYSPQIVIPVGVGYTRLQQIYISRKTLIISMLR